jgi:anti-sigma factor RsiW
VSKIVNISDLDLHAYIDGELDAVRARAIEDAAALDHDLAGRIAAYRADEALLKRACSPLAQLPSPPQWEALVREYASAAPAKFSWRLVGAIAATLLVLLGGLDFYMTRSQNAAGDVVQTALDVRRGDMNARTSVAVTDLNDARRYREALRQIVKANVNVPDLERMGYRVARLNLYDHAAEIQYRDGKNNLFTLYLRASDGKTRFDQFERDGVRICVWQDDLISTVMAGTVSAAQMQRLASLTYLGLAA